MTARERASLSEIEHAARSIIADMFLLALSVEVIIAECKEARRYDDAEAEWFAHFGFPVADQGGRP